MSATAIVVDVHNAASEPHPPTESSTANAASSGETTAAAAGATTGGTPVLTWFALCAVCFFVASRDATSAIGASLQSAGAGASLVALFVAALFVSAPQIAMTSELAGMMPTAHGHVAYVECAFGLAVAALSSYNALVCNSLSLAILMRTGGEYLLELELASLSPEGVPPSAVLLARVVVVLVAVALAMQSIRVVGYLALVAGAAVAGAILVLFLHAAPNMFIAASQGGDVPVDAVTALPGPGPSSAVADNIHGGLGGSALLVFAVAAMRLASGWTSLGCFVADIADDGDAGDNNGGANRFERNANINNETLGKATAKSVVDSAAAMSRAVRRAYAFLRAAATALGCSVCVTAIVLVSALGLAQSGASSSRGAFSVAALLLSAGAGAGGGGATSGATAALAACALIASTAVLACALACYSRVVWAMSHVGWLPSVLSRQLADTTPATTTTTSMARSFSPSPVAAATLAQVVFALPALLPFVSIEFLRKIEFCCGAVTCVCTCAAFVRLRVAAPLAPRPYLVSWSCGWWPATCWVTAALPVVAIGIAALATCASDMRVLALFVAANSGIGGVYYLLRQPDCSSACDPAAEARGHPGSDAADAPSSFSEDSPRLGSINRDDQLASAFVVAGLSPLGAGSPSPTASSASASASLARASASPSPSPSPSPHAPPYAHPLLMSPLSPPAATLPRAMTMPDLSGPPSATTTAPPTPQHGGGSSDNAGGPSPASSSIRDDPFALPPADHPFRELILASLAVRMGSFTFSAAATPTPPRMSQRASASGLSELLRSPLDDSDLPRGQ